MKHVRLMMTAIALSVAGGPSVVNAAEQQLNPKAISITLPDQFQWKRNEALAMRPPFSTGIRTNPASMC
jgi:hypothetical protein